MLKNRGSLARSFSGVGDGGQARSGGMGSFCGDALALGVHWSTTPGRVRQRFGRLEGPWNRRPALPCREGKAGDSPITATRPGPAGLAGRGGAFVPPTSWPLRRLFADFSGYRDGATRAVLANLAAGADPLRRQPVPGPGRRRPHRAAFVGPGRRSRRPSAGGPRTDRLTHATPAVMDAAEFFARPRFLSWRARRRRRRWPRRPAFPTPPGTGRLARQGLASAGEESETVIARLGQACPVAGPSLGSPPGGPPWRGLGRRFGGERHGRRRLGRAGASGGHAPGRRPRLGRHSPSWLAGLTRRRESGGSWPPGNYPRKARISPRRRRTGLLRLDGTLHDKEARRWATRA